MATNEKLFMASVVWQVTHETAESGAHPTNYDVAGGLEARVPKRPQGTIVVNFKCKRAEQDSSCGMCLRERTHEIVTDISAPSTIRFYSKVLQF